MAPLFSDVVDDVAMVIGSGFLIKERIVLRDSINLEREWSRKVTNLVMYKSEFRIYETCLFSTISGFSVFQVTNRPINVQ